MVWESVNSDDREKWGFSCGIEACFHEPKQQSRLRSRFPHLKLREWAKYFGGAPIATVFLVDDEATVRASVQTLLNADGLQCETFASSTDFLNQVSPKARGCVLIDFQIPDMDGVQLHKEMTERGYTLPVIFLTGHGDVPLAVSAMQAGAIDFIEKPFASADFIQRVRAALERDKTTGSLYARLETLTPREREVAGLMAEGLTTKAIAGRLGSSAHTVRNQRTSIFRKMNVQSVLELIRIMNNPEADAPSSSDSNPPSDGSAES